MQKLPRRIEWREGMSTVELALIFPVVLMTVLLLVGILYYFARGAYLQAVVDDALKKSVAIVSHPEANFETGALNSEQLDREFLFAKTIGVFSNPMKNKSALTRQKLDAYLSQRLNAYTSILNPKSDLVIQVTVKQFVLFKKIRIEIYDKEDTAFSKFYTYFAQKSPPPMASGEIMISDAPEMIRNVDYASDSLGETAVIKSLSATLEKVRVVIMNFIENPTGE